MTDIQRYLRIIRLIRRGEATKLSKDDYKFFSKFTFDVDQKAIQKLQEAEEFKDLTPEEISEAMQNSFLQAVQNPEFREGILTSAENIEKKELSDKITSALNLALSGADIATSVSQIQASKQAQDRIRRPGRPAPLTADPALDRALSDAASGTKLDAARALSPAQLQILDQYLADLNTAKSVSGGQAGVYGSLAQVASTRRGRRASELAPLYDQIVRQGEQRYDQLLAQKLQQNQAIQESSARFYPEELRQYGYDSRAVAELGAIGRQNLRSSIGAAASFLPEALSNYQARKRFRDIYNQGLAYGENNARTMAEADYNLYNYNPRPLDNAFDPLYQREYEQVYGIPV